MYCRATLPETTDAKLSAADIVNHNLYLFGDPGSNSVLRRLLPKLPLKWTKDTITIAGQTFTASDHLPLLIFPNPENPKCYIVLNTGFTFSRADWNGSNALQYPHLPDYAVIRVNPADVDDDRTKDTELAGFFDENWRPWNRLLLRGQGDEEGDALPPFGYEVKRGNLQVGMGVFPDKLI